MLMKTITTQDFSYYWASQQALPDYQPVIYEELKEDGFSVQCTIGPWSSYWAEHNDQKGLGM